MGKNCQNTLRLKRVGGKRGPNTWKFRDFNHNMRCKLLSNTGRRRTNLDLQTLQENYLKMILFEKSIILYKRKIKLQRNQTQNGNLTKKNWSKNSNKKTRRPLAGQQLNSLLENLKTDCLILLLLLPMNEKILILCFLLLLLIKSLCLLLHLKKLFKDNCNSSKNKMQSNNKFLKSRGWKEDWPEKMLSKFLWDSKETCFEG